MCCSRPGFQLLVIKYYSCRQHSASNQTPLQAAYYKVAYLLLKINHLGVETGQLFDYTKLKHAVVSRTPLAQQYFSFASTFQPVHRIFY